MKQLVFVFVKFLALFLIVPCFCDEDELSWPPEHYIPDTPGWKELFAERFSQIHQVENLHDRFNAYIHAVYAGLLAPNFTEYGFGLARAPESLMVELRQAIEDGLPTAEEEPMNLGVEGPLTSLLVRRPDLLEKVVHDLHGDVEAWARVPLVPLHAYGFRLYQNQSSLGMHVDRRQSHVISFILHISSSEDAEPWPIVIEDLHGNTHEVILTSGDLLFYESSKCFHGRPAKFNGSWYTSVFAHYYPVDWNDVDYDEEAVEAVPWNWDEDEVEDEEEDELPEARYKLRIHGTTMYHLDCPEQWCVAKDTIKWSGPGEDGYWIAPDMKRHKLDVNVPITSYSAEEF